MTTTLFISLLIFLGAIVDLIVEVVKSYMDTKKLVYNSKDVAIIIAFIVSLVGCILSFILLAIPFTPINIIWIFLEVIAVIVGSQIGYDKLGKRLLELVKGLSTK